MENVEPAAASMANTTAAMETATTKRDINKEVLREVGTGSCETRQCRFLRTRTGVTQRVARCGESTETALPKSHGTTDGSRQGDWVAIAGGLGRCGGQGGSLFTTQQQLRVIENAGFEFLVAAKSLEFDQPFSRSSVVSQRPGVTGQKVRNGADARENRGLMKQLEIRFERTLQLVETIRKTQPPGGAIREDPRKGAGQVPGLLPVTKPDVNPPPHQEHFRMKAVQPRDIVRRRLCFGRISKLQPAKREVEVVSFGIIQFSHAPG